MAALRSRRLEALLGASVDDLTSEHIRGLVSSAIQEDFDLDFKEALYGRGASDRRALAGDVEAMVNTSGGLIVIGIQEDGQARTSAAQTVEVTPRRDRPDLASCRLAHGADAARRCSPCA